MSGFTTTGATTFSDFSVFGRGLLFWRSLTQWIGGMGVITLFVAILPRLAMGVGRIFFAEAPGPTDEKLTPHIRQTAVLLWRLYAGLTLAEFPGVAVGRDADLRRPLPFDDDTGRRRVSPHMRSRSPGTKTPRSSGSSVSSCSWPA